MTALSIALETGLRCLWSLESSPKLGLSTRSACIQVSVLFLPLYDLGEAIQPLCLCLYVLGNPRRGKCLLG